MIVSDLEHIEHQVPMTPLLKKAVDFLRQRDVQNLPEGKVEIDGERVFAVVQRYETVSAAEPKFEYHRKYIDVQFIGSGQEMIGWAPAERMAITEAYDPDKDIAFGTVPRHLWMPLLLQSGQAAVLWPEDAHAPKLAPRTPSAVMKIVVKIAV